MRFDVDLSTGLVRAEFTLAEFQKLFAGLDVESAARPETTREVFKLPVESDSKAGTYYETRIWFDSDGHIQGTCQCGDNVYRRNWCKHLIRADRVRVAQKRSAQFS